MTGSLEKSREGRGPSRFDGHDDPEQRGHPLADSTTSSADTGLTCLAILLGIHGRTTDVDALRHAAGIGDGLAETSTIIILAKQHGMKAGVKTVNPSGLDDLPLPAIVAMKDGSFTLLGKLTPDRVLIQDPESGQPRDVDRGDFERNMTGEVILMTPRENITGEDRAFDFTWFIPPIIKHRHILSQVVLASLILQIFGLATPLFVMLVMDKVLVTGGISTLDVLVIGLVCVGLFEMAMGGLRQYLFAHTTNRVDVELKARLFRHLSALPVSFFESRPVGSIIQRIQELEQVRNFLTGPTLTSIIDLLFTAVFLGVMYYYAPSLTWVVVAFLALFVLIYGLVSPIMKERLARKSSGAVDNQSFLVESVTGIETLKSLAVEPQLQRRWEDQVAAHTKESFDAERLSTLTQNTVTFLNRMMTALLLWIGAKGVISGDLTAGQLMAINMLAGRVTAPAQRLAQLWQQFQQVRISVGRLGEILNQHREPERKRSTLPEIEGRITFDNVSFRYRPDGPQVLHNISFDIQPGEVIGIVGSSGSGKSTLAKLIQRLHVPETGKLLVDGVDLALIDPSWLRRRVGIVLQDNFLFNKSVRDNITLADPSLSMDDIRRAARLAGAEEFILEMSEAYDTEIGERGGVISGGQRQRIALARALVTDPRVLILDEATSALDYESERIIHRNMREITQGRTVFIIAHRLAAVRHCDRIIVIERGRVVEEGTHERLLADPRGRYAQLHRIQVGGGDGIGPGEDTRNSQSEAAQ